MVPYGEELLEAPQVALVRPVHRILRHSAPGGEHVNPVHLSIPSSRSKAGTGCYRFSRVKSYDREGDEGREKHD